MNANPTYKPTPMSTTSHTFVPRFQNTFQPTGPRNWISEELHNLEEDTTEEDYYQENYHQERFQEMYQDYDPTIQEPQENYDMEQEDSQQNPNFPTATTQKNPT
jgi:hypothetical protein